MKLMVSDDEPPPANFKAVRVPQKESKHQMASTSQMGVFLFGLTILFWASSGSAQAFSFVDATGTPKLTDNFFELPQKDRARVLNRIEKKAAKKYSPTEIGRMKANGTWPPLDIIKSSLADDKNTRRGKQKNQPTNYEALQKAAYKIRTNINHQRSSLNQEKANVKTRLPYLNKRIAELKKQEMTAHTKDIANGSVGEGGFLHKLHNKIQKLEKEKSTLVKMKNGGLRDKERRINRGELVYRK
ncbi:MAG: hypothetical protein CMH56_12115 [Myxococcales bacterium]|nr:hypothetical protein [Myxococcales bacterium]|tara:strand:- start:1419 stop:2147 length:729 start_codon:yes stop_codon:yes gene_type:complete